MSVSLAKTTFSIQNNVSKVRTKAYSTPRNAMKFGGRGLAKGEHSIIANTDGTESVVVTFHKA